jgi:tripartite-type tricarboxylate transporter receptor subunit TctC
VLGPSTGHFIGVSGSSIGSRLWVVFCIHVPYRSGFLPDLLAGRVQIVFSTISTSIQHIRSGMLRALAVTTATRSEVLPDVPTLAEFVPGYEADQWYGVGAPKDTPAEVIEKLNKQIGVVVADPVVNARFAGLGVERLSMTSAEFGTFSVARPRSGAR